MKRAFEEFKNNNDLNPGETVLLLKTKHPADKKNYCPITCLNTSYKIRTGLVCKYMRDHTIKMVFVMKGK